MKKLIFLVITTTLSLMAYGQDKTTFNSKDTFTYEKVDILDAKENKLPLSNTTKPKTNTTQHKSLASGIGETEGYASVSLTGGAQYNIPIKVPEGLNGVTPEINLFYNSQNGNGVAGYGWELTGVSSISRIPSTKYHNNTIDAVDLDNLDRFALDGQRLILKSGIYGNNGATYQTERYSNIKVTSYGATPGNPDYFKVNYPDGSIAFYGNSTDSKSITGYAITNWQNPQGVRIDYEYQIYYKTQYIYRIKYGNVSSTSHPYEIRFDYNWNTRRKRYEETFIGGTLITNKSLLRSIDVYSNNTRLKYYELDNTNLTSLNYNRLTSVTEYTGDGSQSHSPIVFNYSDSETDVIRNDITANLSVINIEQRNAETVSLDITGNGKMDFIVYPKDEKDKFWVFTDIQSSAYNYAFTVNSGTFETVFPTTSLNHLNKILAGQNLTVVQNTTNNDVDFKVFSKGPPSSGAPLLLNYTKTWDAPTYNYPNSSSTSIEKQKPQKYLSGDFNGDGLTDVLAVGMPYTTKSCYNCNSTPVSNKAVQFIDLNRTLTSNFSNLSGHLTQVIEKDDQLSSIDFNGDGKTDILHIADNKLFVYGIDDNNMLQLLLQKNNTNITGNSVILLGDYNGDGKTDFLSPVAHNSNSFKVFISRGVNYHIGTKSMPFTYKNPVHYNGTLKTYNLIPLDTNGDGKTDIIEYYAKTHNGSSNGYQTVTLYNNKGYYGSADPHNVFFIPSGTTSKSGNLKHYPIPIFLTSNQPNKNLDFASISHQWVTSFTLTQDHRSDVLLNSIDNNGVTYAIDYSYLDNENSGTNPPVYEPGYQAIYPNVDVKMAISSTVVTKIERIAPNTENLKKLYTYHGAIYNTEGLGFLGFKGISETNWHTGYENRIYNVRKFDPYLHGAITEQYSLPFYYGFITPTTGYISKTTYQNQSSLSANKVFKVWVQSSLNQNILHGTHTNTTYQYDVYNNPETIYTNYSGTSNKTIQLSYSNNTGTNYHIGRVLSKVETSTIGNESFTTEQQFTYTNNLLSQTKTKGNNTPFNINTFNYDNFGNVIKNTVTPYNSPSRIVEFEYDTSGRFLEKSVDVEGLETQYEFNTTSGTLTNVTNPFGLTTQYEYDEWYRPKKETNYLGRKTDIEYNESQDNTYTVTSTSQDGSSTIHIYDPLKRLKRSFSKNIMGEWVGIAYEYDKLDRIYKVSEPFMDITGTPLQWNETEYDLYSRPIKQTLYNGKEITISYSGLTTTVNDGTKTVSSTKDAVGNTLSVTDPGGTINYSYYGNGGLKRTNYNGVIVSNEQDGWGRQTKLTDPSAGTYRYQYNGYGELTKEETPKGKTSYNYSATGQLMQKVIQGDHTEMQIKYSYNPTDKLLTSIALTAPNNTSEIQYSYDNYKRLREVNESNTYAKLIKQYTYDNFGRINTERSFATLLANGKVSSNKIRNQYSHGYLKEIRDFSSNKLIWKIDNVNARGQIKSALMGNGMSMNNLYNAYGLLIQSKVRKDIYSHPPTDIMVLATDFDTERGILNSRSNSMFSWSEEFDYDGLDRLLSFNDNAGDNSMSYDDFGRITQNSTIGDYNYTGTSYQVNTIDLNNQGDLHYQQNTLQQVTYNAFKKPVNIKEEGKEQYNFEYNAFMGRSHMFYGSRENDVSERTKQKHYFHDGSMEISYDKKTDKTVFVSYIGGDGYSAPAIWREEFRGEDHDRGYYYLHRDYLGSIMLITDQDGNAKEKRHFDAWGNIVKLTDGNDNTLEHLTFLDRGYTGHEHLSGVGLIHMNGRLYDPKLKRFLAPDNHIQNPYDTQNFNRYTYVLNNPLKYIDPSGETGENPSGLNQAGYGSLLATAITAVSDNWEGIKGLQVGRWLSTNFDSSRSWINKNVTDHVRNFFRSMFGGGSDSTVLEAPILVNQDPIVASSTGTVPSFYNGGGSESSLGISKFSENYKLADSVCQDIGCFDPVDFAKDSAKTIYNKTVNNIAHFLNLKSKNQGLTSLIDANDFAINRFVGSKSGYDTLVQNQEFMYNGSPMKVYANFAHNENVATNGTSKLRQIDGTYWGYQFRASPRQNIKGQKFDTTNKPVIFRILFRDIEVYKQFVKDVNDRLIY